MALMIRGPLVMADGYKAKSLEGLQEHFSLETVLQAYYDNGRLFKWLQGLGLEDELDAIQALDEKAPDFAVQLCNIFQVPYTGDPVDREAIQERLERLKRLKRVTDEVEHHRSVDRVAFCQEELAKLVLEDGETLIYLCQEEGTDFTFTIPSSRRGVTYRGIPCKGKQPRVRVTRNAWDKLAELDIRIDSCDLIKPEPTEAEPEEPEGNREEPVRQFFQKVLQKKGGGSDTELTMKVFVPKLGQACEATTFQGTAEKLTKDAACLAQEAVGGMELTAEDLSCQLRMRPDFFARAQVRSVHIERGTGGERMVFVDLMRPIRLNGRKYHSIEIPPDKYEALDLLEGSEVDVFCLGDLPPVVRMYERGSGRTLRCPHCGSRFVVRDNRVFCENPVCVDRLHGRIYRFFQKLGLPYDGFFVQKMITALPVKSIKDLFEIDNDVLEQHHLNEEEFAGFPQKLRQAVADVLDYKILGGLGIPALGQDGAKQIIEELQSGIIGNVYNVWDLLVRSLNTLSGAPFETAAWHNSEVIYHWLRCDPRTMRVFHDDIAKILEIKKEQDAINDVRIKNGIRIEPDAFLKSLQVLAPVGFSGFGKNETRRLAQGHGRYFYYVSERKWSEYRSTNKFDVLIVPDTSFRSEMVSYAMIEGIPIYTEEAFLAAFPDKY